MCNRLKRFAVNSRAEVHDAGQIVHVVIQVIGRRTLKNRRFIVGDAGSLGNFISISD